MRRPVASRLKGRLVYRNRDTSYRPAIGRYFTRNEGCSMDEQFPHVLAYGQRVG